MGRKRIMLNLAISTFNICYRYNICKAGDAFLEDRVGSFTFMCESFFQILCYVVVERDPIAVPSDVD